MKKWEAPQSGRDCDNVIGQKWTKVIEVDTESDSDTSWMLGHSFRHKGTRTDVQECESQTAVNMPPQDTQTASTQETRESAMMDIMMSQEATSLPATQGMLDSRMSPEELIEKLKVIPKLPPVFRDLLLESKFLTWFSNNIFNITLDGGHYTRYDQSMG